MESETASFRQRRLLDASAAGSLLREFAWLDPEREGLYSPASNHLLVRLLPSIFKFSCQRDLQVKIGAASDLM